MWWWVTALQSFKFSFLFPCKKINFMNTFFTFFFTFKIVIASFPVPVLLPKFSIYLPLLLTFKFTASFLLIATQIFLNIICSVCVMWLFMDVFGADHLASDNKWLCYSLWKTISPDLNIPSLFLVLFRVGTSWSFPFWGLNDSTHHWNPVTLVLILVCCFSG